MSAPRRAVVFAYSSVGCICLRTLLEAGVEVAVVYTHEDDPGEERWFDSVARSVWTGRRRNASVRSHPT